MVKRFFLKIGIKVDLKIQLEKLQKVDIHVKNVDFLSTLQGGTFFHQKITIY